MLVLASGSKIDLGEDGSYIGTFVGTGEVKVGRGATVVGAVYGTSVSIGDGASLTSDPALVLFADELVRGAR